MVDPVLVENRQLPWTLYVVAEVVPGESIIDSANISERATTVAPVAVIAPANPPSPVNPYDVQITVAPLKTRIPYPCVVLAREVETCIDRSMRIRFDADVGVIVACSPVSAYVVEAITVCVP